MPGAALLQPAGGLSAPSYSLQRPRMRSTAARSGCCQWGGAQRVARCAAAGRAAAPQPQGSAAAPQQLQQGWPALAQRLAAAAAAALLLHACPLAATAADLAGLAASSSQAAPAAQQPPSAAAAAAAAAQQAGAPSPGCPVADVAGLFSSREDEGPEPFTLYGSNFKMYQIEQLDGEKVVSRSRGFTVDSCVSAVEESSETPELQGLSTGDKVRAGGNLLCRRATGQDLKEACGESCKSACSAALDAEIAKQQANTGLRLSDADRKRMLRNCSRQCNYGCVGSGKAHDWVTPSRR